MLITDVVLAQESGPQLYARVSALVPDIAVLFISGYTGESVLARGEPRGRGRVAPETVHADGRWRSGSARSWTRRGAKRAPDERGVVCYTLRAL